MIRPGIEIYNLIGNYTNLATRSKGTPEFDLLIKILMGDVSDNIPSVFPKVGPKTAYKIANMSKRDRDAWLTAKGNECFDQYKRNELLVSFVHIPKELCTLFNNNNTYTFNNAYINA